MYNCVALACEDHRFPCSFRFASSLLKDLMLFFQGRGASIRRNMQKLQIHRRERPSYSSKSVLTAKITVCVFWHQGTFIWAVSINPSSFPSPPSPFSLSLLDSLYFLGWNEDLPLHHLTKRCCISSRQVYCEMTRLSPDECGSAFAPYSSGRALYEVSVRRHSFYLKSLAHDWWNHCPVIFTDMLFQTRHR